MQNKVEICGVNTSKLKVLKNDETQALLLRAKAGGHEGPGGADRGQPAAGPVGDPALHQPGENVDDLFQVGCIGLIKAIDNFNTDLDVTLLHLWRAHDRGGDPAVPPGQQHHAGVPGHAGHRLQGAPGQGGLSWPSTSGSPP